MTPDGLWLSYTSVLLGLERILSWSIWYFSSRTLFFTDWGTSGTNQAAMSLMHKATCSKRIRKTRRMARRTQNCSDRL